MGNIPPDDPPPVASPPDDRQDIDAPSNIRPFKIAPKATKPQTEQPQAVTAVAKKVNRQQRKDLIYRAHLQGATFRELAKQFGISFQQAKKDYDDIAATVTMSGHEDAKRLLWERLELATLALMPAVLKGNVAAIHELAVISERQARMVGADMPVKVASTTPDGQKWAPLQLTLDRLPAETLKALREASDLRILPLVKDGEVVVNE